MLQIEITTNDPDHAAICELYWQLDSDLEFVYSTKEIAKLADVDASKIISIVKKSCQASAKGCFCSDCFKPYVFSSRSDLRRHPRYINHSSENPTFYLCDDCKLFRWEAEQEDRQRQMEARRKVYENAQEEMRRKIRAAYDLSNRAPIDVNDLSLIDAVYLISILRGAQEDLTKIRPISMFEQPLSPDQTFSTEIVNHLFTNGLIYVHPDTDPEGFVNGDIFHFYTLKVAFAPPISKTSPGDPIALVADLLKLVNKEWTEEWRQEALSIWKKVALYECKEYFLYALKEHHFEFTPGKKTTQYLEFALEHFSTSQVFNTIWRAVKDAAAYYQRNKMSIRHAANAAVASIQRISERAIVENWDIKPFGRNFNCPQSCISEVLHNTVLKIGDDGFQSIPSIDIIRAKQPKKKTMNSDTAFQ
jgi:hypothetical protein